MSARYNILICILLGVAIQGSHLRQQDVLLSLLEVIDHVSFFYGLFEMYEGGAMWLKEICN